MSVDIKRPIWTQDEIDRGEQEKEELRQALEQLSRGTRGVQTALEEKQREVDCLKVCLLDNFIVFIKNLTLKKYLTFFPN